MCGIVGFFEKGANKKEKLLYEMTGTLEHRGPDEEGFYINESVALGHKRLIVIDPEGGKQPMIHKRVGKDVVIVYNGELYNTDELRDELLKLGYKFNSHSDTEVLLKSYIEWGSYCLEKINGIFAFAVYDSRDNSLFLARDRFGVKPLFYHVSDGLFAFASEMKALLKHDKISSRVDHEGLCELLAIGPARTAGCCIFKDISEVKPGYFVYYKDGKLINDRYYSIPYRPHTESLTETAHHLRELVIKAVNRQLVSDVPLGTFMSGGLDSGIITAIAQKKYLEEGRVLDTFSIDFIENDIYFKHSIFQPERDNYWINRMVQTYKLNHHEIILDPIETAYEIEMSMKLRDLPGMADIDSSLYLACRVMKEHVTVGISGECADEIFGGYPWFYRPELKTKDTFPWSNDVSFRQGMLSGKLKEKLDLVEFTKQRYKEAIADVPPYEGDDEDERQKRELFYLNITYFMANLLERKDRMSMGRGLEVRVPFCDHELLEYVFNIPWRMKFHNEREKGLLRLAMEGLLPEDILWRKKSPFPKTYHVEYEKLVYGMLQREISEKGTLFTEIIDKNFALNVLEKDIERPFFGQLMKGPQLAAYLVQLSLWLKEYNVDIVL